MGRTRPDDLKGVIDQIGFVQVDSINTVARAHHMILHARQQTYRASHLARLAERDRMLFEHWTHDASILPMAHFPYWRLKFARDAESLRSRWAKDRRAGFEALFDTVLEQIAKTGPCGSSDVGQDEVKGSGGWWDWHPSKTALEYLWRAGELTVTRREGFRKIYDLTENVIPPEYLNARPHEEETIEWACAAALDRLGFATSGEIAAFWDLVTPAEAKAWCDAAKRSGQIAEIAVETADGSTRMSYATPGLTPAAPPSDRVRVLSPFDPALRDRKRAERLFGFHYRIEVFVPEAKRRYGYYVFPLLEGDNLIGRIDMKCDRKSGTMVVRKYWAEAKRPLTRTRRAKVVTALENTARFAGSTKIDFTPGWDAD